MPHGKSRVARAFVVLVVVASTSGCYENDLSSLNEMRPLAEVEVRGGEGTVSLTVSGNRSGGQCLRWSLGSESCSIGPLFEARRDGPWMLANPPESNPAVVCGSWATSLDVVELQLPGTPRDDPLVLRPLPNSRQLLDAHLYVACWPAGEAPEAIRDWEPGKMPYLGVTEDGETLSGR